MLDNSILKRLGTKTSFLEKGYSKLSKLGDWRMSQTLSRDEQSRLWTELKSAWGILKNSSNDTDRENAKN